MSSSLSDWAGEVSSDVRTVAGEVSEDELLVVVGIEEELGGVECCSELLEWDLRVQGGRQL